MVMNQKHLKLKLKSMYFSVLTQLSIYTYDEYLSSFTQQLHTLLEANYTSIYFMNQWTQELELFTELNKEFNCKDIKYVKSQIEHQLPSFEKNTVEVHIDGCELIMMPFYKGSELSGYVIVIVEENMYDETFLKWLKKETARFFSVINYTAYIKNEEKKNELLLNFSSNIYTTSNRTKILKNIISTMQTFYPQFSYNILLSHDHEADTSLPVKTIEYSDDATKRVSTEAFITGNVQLEDRLVDRTTCLYAPLKGMQGVYGILQVIASQIVYFPEKDIQFIGRFSNIAGQAIENATLYQTSHHLVSDLKLINHVTHKLNSNLKLSEIITVVKEQIINICQPTHVGSIYYNEERVNEDDLFEILDGSSPYFKTIEGNTFTNYLANIMKEKPESIFSGNFTKRYQSLSYKSLMTIPMKHATTLHGFIVILHKEPSAFSFENFMLMESLIQHSALALANAILKDQLEKAVITDYLTKLYSRNYLDKMVHMHMEDDETGALVLFDIDNFKRINDTYGHHIGDKVIIQIADVLLSYSGDGNIASRWGGEELALYLPHATLEDGVQIASDIRKKVEEHTYPQVTLSSGVSTWKKGIDDDVNDIFIRADRALYKAKDLGKNRVVAE